MPTPLTCHTKLHRHSCLKSQVRNRNNLSALPPSVVAVRSGGKAEVVRRLNNGVEGEIYAGGDLCLRRAPTLRKSPRPAKHSARQLCCPLPSSLPRPLLSFRRHGRICEPMTTFKPDKNNARSQTANNERTNDVVDIDDGDGDGGKGTDERR